MISLTPHAELLEGEGLNDMCDVRSRCLGVCVRLALPSRARRWLSAPKTVPEITVATCAGALVKPHRDLCPLHKSTETQTTEGGKQREAKSTPTFDNPS